VAQPFKTLDSTHNSEKKLLLACACTRMSGEKAAQVRELIDAGLDWPTLIEAAQAHGVLSLVCRQLLGDFAESVPEEMQATLRSFRDRIAPSFIAPRRTTFSRRDRGTPVSVSSQPTDPRRRQSVRPKLPERAASSSHGIRLPRKNAGKLLMTRALTEALSARPAIWCSKALPMAD